jgi:hypothetical protein
MLDAGGAVVEQFSRQRQERLAVDDQLRGRPLLPQVRDVRGGGALTRGENQRARERGATQNSRFHDDYLLLATSCSVYSQPWLHRWYPSRKE